MSNALNDVTGLIIWQRCTRHDWHWHLAGHPEDGTQWPHSSTEMVSAWRAVSRQIVRKGMRRQQVMRYWTGETGYTVCLGLATGH